MEAKLVVVGGKANRSEVKLKLPAMLGRGRDIDVTVAHATVSRHHCLIYELDGALVVRDNGSLNGTLVDGKRIKEALLRPGQSLTIGPLTFRAEYEHSGSFPQLGAPPPAAAASDEPSGLPVINASGGSRRETQRAAEPAAAAKAQDESNPRKDSAPQPVAGNFDFLDEEPAHEEPAAQASDSGFNFLNDTDHSPGDSADSFDFLNDEPAAPLGKPEPAVTAAGEAEEVFRLADDEPVSPGKKDAKTRGKPTTANGSGAKQADEPLKVNASAGDAAKKRSGNNDPALDDFLDSLGLDE